MIYWIELQQFIFNWIWISDRTDSLNPILLKHHGATPAFDLIFLNSASSDVFDCSLSWQSSQKLPLSLKITQWEEKLWGEKISPRWISRQQHHAASVGRV